VKSSYPVINVAHPGPERLYPVVNVPFPFCRAHDPTRVLLRCA
jgi:hypothetical protein